MVSLGGIVYSRSLKIGGDHMDQALVRHLEDEHGITVGLRSANQLKEAIGTAVPGQRGASVTVRGRDLQTGFPRAVEVNGSDVAAALQEPVGMIVDAVMASMEHTPPDLLADIHETGIVLAGGGAQLDGMDRVLGMATGMATVVAEAPQCASVRGAADLLLDAAMLREAAC